MKLLFDQNLSPSLVDSLADIYPESMHVQSVGLDRADDTARLVRGDFARLQNLVLVIVLATLLTPQSCTGRGVESSLTVWESQLSLAALK